MKATSARRKIIFGARRIFLDIAVKEGGCTSSNNRAVQIDCYPGTWDATMQKKKNANERGWESVSDVFMMQRRCTKVCLNVREKGDYFFVVEGKKESNGRGDSVRVNQSLYYIALNTTQLFAATTHRARTKCG